MSKRAAMMLSVSLLGFLSGCDGDNTTTPAAPTSAPAATAAPATPPASDVAATTSVSAAGTISPWTPPASDTATSKFCSLDAINGVGSVNSVFSANAGQHLTFEGWAASMDKHDPGSISIVLEGPPDFQIAGSTGVARSDVASAYGPGVSNAGFKVAVPTFNVPAGKYTVLIAGVGGASGFTCNTKTTLVVK
jgi:hypothetical protein